jgi:hypothetical protein
MKTSLPRPLHLSFTDAGGGAAEAASRLHRALRRHGSDSRMLVADRRGSDAHTLVRCGGAPLAHRQRFWNYLPLRLFYRKRRDHLFSAALVPAGNQKDIRRLKPDLVHLHWINEGMLPPWELAALPGPLVWTWHDAWGATGGCHYSGGCQRCQNACGRCPALSS